MAGQKLLGLLAPVAAKIGVEQIHHRPKMPSFFDIDLEQVAQVVERRAGKAEPALLLNRRRLGIALGNDEPPQARPVLARHLLPDRLANVVAKTDSPIDHRIGKEDAPTVFGHRDKSVARPAFGVDAGGSSQIDLGPASGRRSHVPPPVEKARLPVFERALQGAVVTEPDVIGYPFVIIDRHRLPQSYRQSYPLPIEPRPRAATVALQRTLLAGRVRPREDPVLPRRKPAKNLRRNALGASKPKARFHAGQRVW